MANPYRAKSLTKLLEQINLLYPNRGKVSDGWISDAAHAARVSDHNPLPNGAVTAQDITHDPKHGLDAGKIAEALVASKDNRVKYIIWNKKIIASPAWKWVDYHGSNPHTKHIHISVNRHNYDDARPWAVGKTISKEEKGNMAIVQDVHEERHLKTVVLHREVKDAELGGEVGKTLKQSLDGIKNSQEWHTQNHILRVAYPEALNLIQKLQATGGKLTVDEENKIDELNRRMDELKKLLEETKK